MFPFLKHISLAEVTKRAQPNMRNASDPSEEQTNKKLLSLEMQLLSDLE